MKTGRFFTNKQDYNQKLDNLNYQEAFRLFYRLVKQFELAIQAGEPDARMLSRLEQLFQCLMRVAIMQNEGAQVFKRELMYSAHELFVNFSDSLEGNLQLPLQYYADVLHSLLSGLLERSSTFQATGQAVTALLAKNEISSVLKFLNRSDWVSPIILVSFIAARSESAVAKRQLLGQLIECLQPFKYSQWHVHYGVFLAWQSVFDESNLSARRALLQNDAAGSLRLDYMLGIESNEFYHWRSTRKRIIRKTPMLRCAHLWALAQLEMRAHQDDVMSTYVVNAKTSLLGRERQEGFTDFEVGYLFDNLDDCIMSLCSPQPQVPLIRPVLPQPLFTVTGEGVGISHVSFNDQKLDLVS